MENLMQHVIQPAKICRRNGKLIFVCAVSIVSALHWLILFFSSVVYLKVVMITMHSSPETFDDELLPIPYMVEIVATVELVLCLAGVCTCVLLAIGYNKHKWALMLPWIIFQAMFLFCTAISEASDYKYDVSSSNAFSTFLCLWFISCILCALMLHFYFKNVNREKKIRENVAELVVDIQERP